MVTRVKEEAFRRKKLNVFLILEEVEISVRKRMRIGSLENLIEWMYLESSNISSKLKVEILGIILRNVRLQNGE